VCLGGRYNALSYKGPSEKSHAFEADFDVLLAGDEEIAIVEEN
jgi:hypothetical protein